MKRFSAQLKKKADNIRLRAAEKRDLRERLVSYMEYHPLPADSVKIHSEPVQMEFFKVFHISAKYIRTAMAMTAVFIFIITPFLAEKTVPGDILYPVKGLTEDIRGSLNLTPYEKEAWETKRLERRVAEARLLEKEGKLTPEVEAGVLVAVQGHKSAAEAQIKSLQTTDSDGAGLAQMTFSSVLDVQTAILRSDISDTTAIGTLSVAITSVLEAGRSDAKTEGLNAPVSFERLMAQLEIETTRAYELLTSNESVATASEQSDTRRRLTDLEFKIKDASSKHESDPEEAVSELRTVWSDLQKLITFMTDINVRQSVSIESLVPIVLTSEERKEILVNKYEALVADLVRLDNAMEIMIIMDPDSVETIKSTLPEVNDLITLATSSIASSSLAEAEVTIVSARVLIDSMMQMAGISAESSEDILDDFDKGSTTSSHTNTEVEVDPDDDKIISSSSTPTITNPSTTPVAS